LQVKLCDPCLSALYVPWCEKALYKYSSFPFLSSIWHRRKPAGFFFRSVPLPCLHGRSQELFCLKAQIRGFWERKSPVQGQSRGPRSDPIEAEAFFVSYYTVHSIFSPRLKHGTTSIRERVAHYLRTFSSDLRRSHRRTV